MLTCKEKKAVEEALQSKIVEYAIEHDAEIRVLQQDDYIPEELQGRWLEKKNNLINAYRKIIGELF